MCGIAGYAGEGPPSEAVLHRMCDALVHRGPDQDGYLLGERIALGMRRLSIIDVASGQQPVYNEDATVAVVFNGEIYNFAELRAGLESRGHRFGTGTDTECIVHLYEEMGERCVEALRGMFAFALWDAPQRRLLLARDRTGKKPLYYRSVPGGIWFASELKALLAGGAMDRRVDPCALHQYLTLGYVPAPMAILEGVAKLPPAHTLTWQDGASEQRRYWRLCYEPKAAIDAVDAAGELRELISEATRIRLVSERPLGAFLSGGVDSSMVVAAMAGQMAEPVRTFSIGFEDRRFDERSYARMVAERFGTQHEELVVSPRQSDLQALLARLTWFYDEPFADSSAIPSFYLAEMARRHVVVALNGDGGDESFGGYDRYVAARLADRVSRVGMPESLATLALRGVNRLPDGGHRSRSRRAKRFLGFALSAPATRYASLMAVFTADELSGLYTDNYSELVGTSGAPGAAGVPSVIEAAFAASGARDPADVVMDVDVGTYLPGDLLVKVDIATMANSLEGRSPLLDHKVMEFAAALPADLKVRGRTGKWILKEAGRGWLPDAVLDRPKMGFGVPVAGWLRHELRALLRDVLTDYTAQQRGYFQPAAVQRLLDDHDAGADHGAKLWALLRLELWHRMFIDSLSLVAPGAAVR